jgi:intracellular sulfur oxidation DsrE/DsrF family protein
MEKNDITNNTDRRRFLGSITAGAATLGLASLFQPLQANATDIPGFSPDDPDAWFRKLKGKKHSIVFDATEPHELMPFLWARIFLLTNGATGTQEKDCGVVVVLRHAGIPFAFEDRIWQKYKFADVFKFKELPPFYQGSDKDTVTSTRNPLWKTKKDDFAAPGVGSIQIGITDLQASGVMLCVCNAAMTVYSAILAGGMNMKPEEVYSDWKAGLLPGVQIVPSGVWAVGRAQENGCQYCFAG